MFGIRHFLGRLGLILALIGTVSGCATTSSAEVSLSRNGFTPADVACMAEAIYHEARGTGEEGRVAVGEVILNRVADPRFPDTVCAVVDDNCQFSYRCDAIPDDEFGNPTAYARARATSFELMTSNEEDITSGALFFHAETMRPNSWFSSLPRVGTFGGNIFYRSSRG